MTTHRRTGRKLLETATTKPQAQRWSKMIGVLELAEKLGVHPMSIPRMVREKEGFPKPVKLFHKNLWPEPVIDAYLARLVAAKSQGW